ncbi:MAG: cell wall hydrolase [Novosphingobium sp.]
MNKVQALISRTTARFADLARRGKDRPWGKPALVLLAAFTVPAIAAPGEWGGEIGNAGKREVAVEPMPFEKAGDSFPGSAFYYLATTQDEQRMAGGGDMFGQGIHSDADPAPASALAQAGPAARAIRIDNSGVDRGRAEQCLTAAIYYEAASEPDGGQRAVAQVVLNRVAHSSYPNTVCGVVYQGSERSTGCQFSFTCDGSLARKPNPMFWERAANVARAALAGYVYAPVGLATHYHTFAVHPSWNRQMINVANIGAHRFFRMPGGAGQPGAFRFAYLGGEPMAVPHRRNAQADARPDPALDPLEMARAYDSGLKQAQSADFITARVATPQRAAAAPGPAPAYAQDLQQRGGDKLYRGENLPQTTGIKPEYRESGRWIVQPGQ